MKKIILLGIVALASFTQSFAQTADEIIDTYIETIGGREAWSKVNGMKMTAEVAVQGMNLPLEMINLKDGRMIVKFELQGKELTQMAYDGETLWSTNFMTMKAEKSESEDTENYKRSMLEFPSALLNYKNLNYSVELMNEGATENIEGVDCLKLKLTKTPQLVDGKEVDNIEYYYMDAESFVPIVMETEIKSGQMAGQISQSIFSDYQEVDNVYVAFSITQKVKDGMGQEIRFNEVIINPEVDPTVFKYSEE